MSVKHKNIFLSLMGDIETFISNSNGYEDLEIFGDDSSKIKCFAFDLDDTIIDVLFCDYSNKQFLVVTEYKKIGTLISVTKGFTRNINGFTDTYDVKTISGLDKQEYHLAARYLAEQLSIVKPVVFGIGLKNVTVKTLRGITKAIKENLGW